MFKTVRSPSRVGVLLVALLVGLLPALLAAAPINGKKLLAPNPATDFLAARIRNSMIKRLQISDDQLRSIQNLIDNHRETLLAEIVAAKEGRLSLMDQMRAEKFDPESIRQVHAEVAAVELRLLLHTSLLMRDVQQILTPAQRQEAALLVEELLEGAKLRFDDLEEKFADGELLGKRSRDRASKGAKN